MVSVVEEGMGEVIARMKAAAARISVVAMLLPLAGVFPAHSIARNSTWTRNAHLNA